MRKKTIKRWWDYTFWYVLYMLPVIIAVVASFSAFAGTDLTTQTSNVFAFTETFDRTLTAFGFGSVGVVGQAVLDIFGANGGIMPVITGDIIPRFADYFVIMVLVHLCIDFILFIPRLAHSLLDKFEQKE